MKKNVMSTMAALAIAGLFSANLAFANEQHGMMMGNMDMHQMMNDCMKMHKDGKMCEHSTMEKCQSQMDKSECQKMMKAAKKDSTKKSK